MKRGGQGAAPCAGHPLGVPPSFFKRSPPPHLSLTPPREGSLSPSRIYPPWSRTSEIHVPGGFSARKSCASAASLERGGGGCSVPRTCVRARMHCCFAALGLPLDLEIGKRSSTSTTSLDSLSFVGLQGYVLYGYISARCLYLVDRSWYIVVPIVGNFLFSMLRTLQLPGPNGFITIAGDFRRSMECASAGSSLAESLVIAQEKRRIQQAVALAESTQLN